ncbi:TerD family protein [Gordonia sp. NB41Y]|uniref:TerD family protein n=1 Tax=Gordonia sp. NB41Y TaxID=875808 RepID=UPI00273B3C2A|nr:TerD family protein [Gordonia sp. NB41Y]WLP88710.1 TerD family protein [Gordonia sp. NB41Y]
MGPRAARIHVGGGRTTLSTGLGPFFASTALLPASGRRRTTVRRTSRSTGPSPSQLAAAQRAAERAQRESDRDAAIRELTRMRVDSTTAHLEPFRQSVHPVLPPPPPIGFAGAQAQAQAHFTAGVSRLARTARAQARDRAREAAQDYLAAETQRREAIHQSLQSAAGQWWEALCHNDESTVCEAVNIAFADNPAAGCAVGVQGTTLSILMRLPDLDTLPTQMPATSPAGRPTLKAMPKRDRMRWWLHILASNLAAAVLEGLATAPSIDAVSAAVVTRMPDTQRLGVVAYGTWSRSAMAARPWRTAEDAWRILDIGSDVRCSIRATASGNISSVVRPLDLTDIPALAALVADCVDEPDSVLGRIDAELSGTSEQLGGLSDADPYAPIGFAEWLAARTAPHNAPSAPPAPSAQTPPCQSLRSGESIDLPEDAQFELHVEFRSGGADADLSLLLVDEFDSVATDDDFVFYNNPSAADGTARLLGKFVGDTTAESAVIHPRALRPSVRKVVVSANMDVAAGLTFSALTQAAVTMRSRTGAWGFVPRLEPSVRAVVLLEIYQLTHPDGSTRWKMRAVGQGWDDGLAALARAYQVDIDE